MPTPPIDNATPLTCPSCGAEISQSAEFCPRCGARLLEAQAAPSTHGAGFFVRIIGLVIGTLVFGVLGFYATKFSLSVMAVADDDPSGFSIKLLMLSLPVALVGIVGVWRGISTIAKRFRE